MVSFGGPGSFRGNQRCGAAAGPSQRQLDQLQHGRLPADDRFSVYDDIDYFDSEIDVVGGFVDVLMVTLMRLLILSFMTLVQLVMTLAMFDVDDDDGY